MNGMTEEQITRQWERIKTHSDELLTDKDKEVLTTMLTCEPGLKAFGKIYALANAYPSGFMQIDFSTAKGASDAAQLQGHIKGLLSAVDVLFNLVTLPEENEDD
jgi:hypothetical protein